MDAAIPCDVDEADKLVVVVGADMGEAAGQDGGEVAQGRGAQVTDQRVLSSAVEGKGSMRSSGMGIPSCGHLVSPRG